MQIEDWSDTTLANVAEKKIVYGIVQAGDHDEGGMPYIKSSDVGKTIQPITLTKTALSIHQKYHRSKVQPGDIVFSLRGNTGATSIVPDGLPEANLTQGTARIAVGPDYDNRFVRYVLASDIAMRQVLAVAKGSTFTEVSLDALRKITIPHPPLLEQRKIADILSTWDAAIEKTEALLATAKAQKRALMQSLLTGRRRFPEFEGQPWQELRFEDVFSRVRRKNTVGNDNVLTISAQHGLVSQETYFNKRVAAKDLSGYTLLHQGDFAFNKSYSQGYPLGAIKMLEIDEPGVVSSLYLCFALTDAGANSREFFRHFFEAGRFNHEIYKIAQEGARNHGLLNVSSTDFFRARLSVPSLTEQKLIARAIGSAEVKVDVHRRELAKLRTEKKALMQQLLTGKRRVVV
ncbi:restriction endonuclease subunit S [uncultured Tateyamaria sp.]|uniref:restriction endonuclease subunit S n=1 Tax=uncultured Tateyamaria sp. TaxID=455651 RepID=UPI00260DA6B0|nr:restriction endonuclease subunit S [uncultured Tateyamaria sp.]